MKKVQRILIILICAAIILINTNESTANKLGLVNLSGVTNALCYIYNTNGDYINRSYVNNSFELPVGEYVFSVNGTDKKVNVQAGNNEFPLGNIKLSAVTSTLCYVFSSSDTSDDYLSRHYANNLFDLFPGTYTLSVNGTVKEINVKAGKNEFPLGNIKLSAVTSTLCYVFSSSDTSGDYLSRHYANNLFDLFPGTYTLSVNGTVKEVSVKAGKNEFQLGNIKISTATSTLCYVYSSPDTSGDYLSRHYANNLFDLFPGVYTFSLNETLKEVTIFAGENVFSENLIRLNPIPQEYEISGCINYKTEPMKNSTIMIIQSGQFHKKTSFDSNGCFSIKNVTDETPFSIMIRHNKNK